MRLLKKYLTLYTGMLCLVVSAFSQPVNQQINPTLSTTAETAIPADTTEQKSFIINDIKISGNKHTKGYIIERELTFKKGDSVYLPQLIEHFQRSKDLLINTRLFNEVVIALKSFRGYLVDVQIEVKERWYVFPIPYFKPVDRNLSVWADKGYNLNRINYGLKFTHYNFTGRNDKLKLWLITGYARQIELAYEQPYADKKLKHGFGLNISYSAFKEINAGTVNDVQRFLRADSIPYAGKYLNKNFNVGLLYSYRPALRTVHNFSLSFSASTIDSAVTVVNPKYFPNGSRKLQYPELSYSMNYQNVDYIPYVLKGFMGNINFTRRGVSREMNLNQLTGRFTRGWAWSKSTFYGLQGAAILRVPFNQPFYNQPMFGYGDLYLRGLEKYVIDGVAGVLLRNTIRQRVLDVKLPIGISKSHSVLPLRIYLKTYADWGYGHNKFFKDNRLVNKMLYTAGAGLDVVSLYDFVFRVEYSFNQLGQNGLFFHVRNDF